jgi:hypothetical protein
MQKNICNPRKFSIRNPNRWNAELLQSIVDIFQHFAKNGILWETLELLDVEEDNENVSVAYHCSRAIICMANSMHLFRNFFIWLPPGMDTADVQEESKGEFVISGVPQCLRDEFILPGRKLNLRLERLSVCTDCALSLGDFRSLESILLTIPNLKTLELCAGLRK